MNSLTRIMSYDKTKIKNQENCNCKECISVKNTELENQIIEYPKLSEEEIEQIINEKYFDKDEKTKTFIRKALKIHGDRYDYSNVVYIKAKIDVEIICRVEGHKPFPITPDSHLQGHGCSECSGNKKLTLEEFIKREREIHGDKYDYSKVNYVNMNTEVIIICPKHGDFPQTPANHLKYQGCKFCSIEKRANNLRLTTEEFIEKANEVHGEGRYDYSEVEYVDYATEVIIICRNHDTPYKFKQTPNNHLSGAGCRKCQYEKVSKSLKSDTKEFIEKANIVHGEGRYDYSEVDYKGSNIDVWIICHKHDEPYRFPQTPSDHLQGKGCRICANKKLSELNKLTLEEFIEKANEVHGVGTYDYSKVNYVDTKTEVIIICPKHGEFPQTPDNHIYGKSGCSKCNKNIGENAIRNFLTKNNIEFEEQKKFEGCEYKRQLRFDFYLPKYNLCIESDGNVHSDKINWNGKMTDEEMEKELKLNQHRDEIKNEYCKNKGINLVRVNNLKAVEELSEYFQNL